jgi:hypothetical protein
MLNFNTQAPVLAQVAQMLTRDPVHAYQLLAGTYEILRSRLEAEGLQDLTREVDVVCCKLRSDLAASRPTREEGRAIVDACLALPPVGGDPWSLTRASLDIQSELDREKGLLKITVSGLMPPGLIVTQVTNPDTGDVCRVVSPDIDWGQVECHIEATEEPDVWPGDPEYDPMTHGPTVEEISDFISEEHTQCAGRPKCPICGYSGNDCLCINGG